MTPETKEQKEKRELIYFRERARSKKQIWQVFKSLCWFLIVTGLGYFVFNCAIIGARTFGGLSQFVQGELWGISILWLFWCTPIWPIYAPIMRDAGKWLRIVAKRLKAAKEAWGES